MNLIELLILAVGVSMDAFAVAICKGLAMKKVTFKNCGIVGLYFGVFQAGMPLLGYILGVSFQEKIEAFDHWIAFFLLAVIGANMIKESLCHGEECPTASLGVKNMIILSVATSIDALAVGITFACLSVKIVPAVSLIGITTCIISMAGVKFGNLFGVKYKAKAEFAGGAVLILLGAKILLDHLHILPLSL